MDLAKRLATIGKWALGGALIGVSIAVIFWLIHFSAYEAPGYPRSETLRERWQEFVNDPDVLSASKIVFFFGFVVGTLVGTMRGLLSAFPERSKNSD